MNKNNNKNNNNNNINKLYRDIDLNPKDFFNAIAKDLYLDFEDATYKEGILKQMNSFSILISLQLSGLNVENTNSNKDLICSSTFMFDTEYYQKKILKNLEQKDYSNDLHIVIVSWKKSINFNEPVENENIPTIYTFKNIFNEEYNLYIYNLSYHSFFNNLENLYEYRSNIEKQDKNYLGINPIINFKGMSMSVIVKLFKNYGYNLNGGTITRRHKLSLPEFRLSKFLDLTLDNTYLDKTKFLEFYSEKLFSSNKFKDGSVYTNYIVHYNLINIYRDIKLDTIELNKNICKIKLELESNNTNKDSLKNEIEYNNLTINNKLKTKSTLKNKLVSDISTKHKASLTGRIKILMSEVTSLNNKNKENIIAIKTLTRDFQNLQDKLAKLNVDLEEKQQKTQEIQLQIDKLLNPKLNDVKPFNPAIDYLFKDKSTNINKNVKRGYHTLGNRRFYSTSLNKINFNVNSPIFLELQRILNNSSLNNETQLKIEQFLKNQGYLLMKNRLNQNSDINFYKINSYILDYLQKSLIELNKLVENYRLNLSKLTNLSNLEKIEFLIVKGLSNDLIISHLLGRLLRIISNNNLINKNTSSTELALDLGNSLLFEYYSQEFNKKYDENKSQGLNDFIQNDLNDIHNLASDDVLFNLGIKILNLLVEVGLIHSVINTIDVKHKSHVYIANAKIQEDLGKSLEMLSISYKIPMIVPPKEYGHTNGTDILGGYLLNDKEYIIPIIIKNPNLLEQSKINQQNNVYDLVNNLSSVSYKINTQVLDFILENGLKYGLILDFSVKHELEIKKINGKKLTILETKTLDSFLSKKQLEMNILGLAIIFKNVPQFYIPVRLDNRGRVYCNVDFLHYQGIELAKSLLLFSKGEKIPKSDSKSIKFLKIFGANCFGNGIGKKSFEERVQWVNENENDILDFKNGNLISKADSKLLFIAFCFEFLNYHNSLLNNETFYISHFPIQLDATCNGYQHLSLLIGDQDLAVELNIIPGQDEVIDYPKDFYNFVALKINDYFLKLILVETENLEKYKNLNEKDPNYSKDAIDKSKKIIESCNKLLKFKINRSIVKAPLMVKPYNASFSRMTEYIKENLKKTYQIVNDNGLYNNLETEKKKKYIVLYESKTHKDVKINNFDVDFFISTMEKVFYSEFPKLKSFSDYLLNVASICNFLNIPIIWSLPTGLEVNQYYVDTEAIRLKPFKFKKSTYNLKIKTNKINKKKQSRALMPNLIHSLDASSLSLILNLFYENRKNDVDKINFFAIHDCFAVTANNIDNLFKYIKLVYIKIYSEDSYLLKFDKGIIDSIKNQFGAESFNDKNRTITVNNTTLEYPNVNEVIVGKIEASQIKKSKFIIN